MNEAFSSSPLSTSWYLVAIAQYPRPTDDLRLFDGDGTQQQHLLVRSKSTEFVRDRKVRVDREKEQHKWQPRRLVQRAKSTHWLHNM